MKKLYFYVYDFSHIDAYIVCAVYAQNAQKACQYVRDNNKELKDTVALKAELINCSVSKRRYIIG